MNDTLGDRVKKYEKTSQFRLLPKSPLFIRIDGRAFHTFTRGCDKPFDKVLIDAMVYATQMTAKEMSGFKLAYVQSDEATFMITDTDTFETQGWFDYELNKIVSISASAFTAYFNSYWFNHKDAKRGYGGTDGETKLAMFDSRAFTVPVEDAPNAFIWRQRDWERNAVQMMARALYSHKQCEGKKIPELRTMISEKKAWFLEMNDQIQNGTWVEQYGTLSYDKLDYNGVQRKLWTPIVS